MTTNFFDGMADIAFMGLVTNRRHEDVVFTPERRKQPNLANQFIELCEVCGIAGCVTCGDDYDAL